MYKNGDKVSVAKIEHGTKIYYLTDKELNQLKSEKQITDKYNLNIKKYDNGFYSVYFQDKNRFHMVNLDGNNYKVYD